MYLTIHRPCSILSCQTIFSFDLPFTFPHPFSVFISLLSGFNLIHYLKGESSSHLRGICPVTFDVEAGFAAPGPAESCILSVSPEAAEDPADQQREPGQSQIDLKTQTSFAGVEDVCTEQERSSPDVENAAEDETDLPGEEEVKEYEPEADVLESLQDVPSGSEVDVVEEKEEPQTAQRSDPEPDDPSERPRSAASPSEPAAAANGGQTCETVAEAEVGELDDGHTGDDDVGIREESPEQAEEQTELKDEAVEATEEDNPEGSCSAEPDLDSSITLSKHPEGLISRKRDHHARKRESRSLRYLKVLQASVVTQLKW